MSTSNQPNLLLFGASGRVGGLLLELALDQGYTVTALVRNPSTLNTAYATAISSKSLTIVKGDPTDQQSVTSAMDTALSSSTSSDVVIISTLGQTRASGNPWAKPTSPKLFMSRSAQAALSSISSRLPADQRRIRKYVVLSAFGTTTSFANLNFLMRLVMKYSYMSQTVEDHDAVDAVLRGQDRVQWVEVRSSMLKGEDAQEVKTFGAEGDEISWLPSVSRASVVEFLLKCVNETAWDGKAVVISN